MYGEIIVMYLFYFGALIGLAFIPANIARSKGHSYGGFYAFGLFFFLPALIVALVIEDKSMRRTPPNYGYPYNGVPPQGQPYGYAQPAYGYGQSLRPAAREIISVVARNCYVEAPFRPLKASLLQEPGGKIVCSVCIKAYGDVGCDSMMVRISLYDVFNNVVASGQQPVRNMSRKGDEITFQMDVAVANLQDVLSAKVFELYINATAVRDKTVYYNNTPVYMNPLSLEDLAEVKSKYGTDAIAQYAEKENGGWQCVCGSLNEGELFCPTCGRKKEFLAAIASGQAPTIEVYIDQLHTNINTIDAAKEALAAYQNILPQSRYDAAMQFFEEQTLLIRRYGASFSEKEKTRLAAILKGE